MLLKVLLALVMGALLSGCEDPLESVGGWAKGYLVGEAPGPQKAVIVGGFKVIVDNSSVKIWGYDLCPVSTLDKVFGLLPTDQRGCIEINPETRSVKVQYALNASIHHEVWTVTHDKGLFGLKRPNGDWVYGENAKVVMSVSQVP